MNEPVFLICAYFIPNTCRSREFYYEFTIKPIYAHYGLDLDKFGMATRVGHKLVSACPCTIRISHRLLRIMSELMNE